jgi:CHASE3 domain sensor protein
MNRLKSMIFVIGVMLFTLAATSIYLSIQGIAAIIPEESYEDRGVHTFLAYQVLPTQVANTGATGRSRRMNPTKTVYKVDYLDVSGSGYQWHEQVLSRDQGQDMVDAGRMVQRRVLSIRDEGTYITLEPEQDAQSYTEGLKQKYTYTLGMSAAYILIYLGTWAVLWNIKRGKA